MARAYRDCADTVHQTALTRRKRALPNADHIEITGVMWLFRQQPGDLKPEERALIERLLRYSPQIAAACHLRQDLTDLGVRNDTTAGAKRALRVWCTRVRERGLAECESFLGTRDWWREEITPGFQGRQTSGLVEGFNNRVQVLKQCCDGIFNIGSLSQRFTLDWHGYQLSGHP